MNVFTWCPVELKNSVRTCLMHICVFSFPESGRSSKNFMCKLKIKLTAYSDYLSLSGYTSHSQVTFLRLTLPIDNRVKDDKPQLP